MNIIGNYTPKTALKYKRGLVEFDSNPCASAVALGLPTEKALKLITHIPDHGGKFRSLPVETRELAVNRIHNAIIPMTNTISVYRLICRCLPSAYLGRDFNDPNFFKWIAKAQASLLNGEELTKLKKAPFRARETQFVAHPKCALLVGKPGTGKTSIVEHVLNTCFPDRVLMHIGNDGAFTQLPYVFVECSHLGSARGLIKDIIRAIAELAGYEPADLCPAFNSAGADDLMPHLVALCLIFSVGTIFIDEAEAIKSASSGGYKALAQVWVRLINRSGTSLVLISNPEIHKALERHLKAKLRLSGHGTIVFDNLAGDSIDWLSFFPQLWKLQYTKKFTFLSKELMDAMHDRSQGLIKLASYLYGWVQLLAMEEGGKDEEITPALVNEAFRRNGQAVHAIIHGIKWQNHDSADDIDLRWATNENYLQGISSSQDKGDEEVYTPESKVDEVVEPESTALVGSAAKRRTGPVRKLTKSELAPLMDRCFVSAAEDATVKKGRSSHLVLEGWGWIADPNELVC